MDIHTSFFQYHFQILGNLPIHAGQNPIHGLQYGDLFPQVGIEGGKFHADHASAYNNKAVVWFLSCKKAGAVLHTGQIDSRNRRDSGFSPGRDKDAGRCKKNFLFPCRYQHLFFFQDPAGTGKKSHTLFLKLHGNSLPQGGDYLKTAFLQPGHIHMSLRHAQPLRLRFLQPALEGRVEM